MKEIEFGYYFDQPKFTDEEYQERLRKVRQGMVEEGMDALLLFSPKNLFYLTGYYTIGFENFQTLIIPLEGEVALYLREMEKAVGEATTWVKNIPVWADQENPVEKLTGILKEWDLFDKRIGMEKNSPFFTARHYEQLVGYLKSTPSDGSKLVNNVRAVKSEQEIVYIKKAGVITEVGMKAAMESIAEGKSENEVVADFYAAMIRAGSEPVAGGPILTAGTKSGVAHTNWQRHPLKKGDTVLLEFSGCWNTYSAPLMRSAAVLEASDQVKHMMDACIGGLEAAIQTIKPGVTSGEVDEACRKVIEDAGFESMFRKRTGYSIGVGPMSWGEGDIFDLKRDDPRVLEPGMVFHMPPALRDYKKSGVGVSESVVVTAGGCHVINNFPRELYITGK